MYVTQFTIYKTKKTFVYLCIRYLEDKLHHDDDMHRSWLLDFSPRIPLGTFSTLLTANTSYKRSYLIMIHLVIGFHFCTHTSSLNNKGRWGFIKTFCFSFHSIRHCNLPTEGAAPCFAERNVAANVREIADTVYSIHLYRSVQHLAIYLLLFEFTRRELHAPQCILFDFIKYAFKVPIQIYRLMLYDT